MNIHLTREEGRQLLSQKKTKRGNKYNAKRVLHDGYCFDSIAERDHYIDLKVRERLGEISEIDRQHPYELWVNGLMVCIYKADFRYWDHRTKRRHVIDVKGVETDVFKLKRKLMRACYGIEIEVVKNG
ncbi:DUF1064 domain-containing protein [Rhizobium sp. Root1204]|uniref:DUF1064 domain-containing protein n=1 Tax=Rhizobium sp. Root1204 TaxID=1736428 RepID=UPI000714D025|nr:DUF1064 domain-containing protein [Rhizobium sp. Root1204]KQV31125.1 hypothetical protein ASC96_08005 [Rhizobium sp. Root1204]